MGNAQNVTCRTSQVNIKVIRSSMVNPGEQAKVNEVNEERQKIDSQVLKSATR